jgi:hypothetical protein
MKSTNGDTAVFNQIQIFKIINNYKDIKIKNIKI